MCVECGCGLDTGLTCPKCGGRVVLIDNQATCLECGATNMEYQGHHHHHHDERGLHEETRLDDPAQLRVLLTCWIARNEGHADSLRQWAARAREMGLDESARQIEAAVAHMLACNWALDAALQLLEEMG